MSTLPLDWNRDGSHEHLCSTCSHHASGHAHDTGRCLHTGCTCTEPHYPAVGCPCETLRTTPAVGDRVQVGKGKKTWQVLELWTAPDGTAMAHLLPDGGYTRTSVNVDRLTIVERA